MFFFLLVNTVKVSLSSPKYFITFLYTPKLSKKGWIWMIWNPSVVRIAPFLLLKTFFLINMFETSVFVHWSLNQPNSLKETSIVKLGKVYNGTSTSYWLNKRIIAMCISYVNNSFKAGQKYRRYINWLHFWRSCICTWSKRVSLAHYAC